MSAVPKTELPATERLKITEVFLSLQGESVDAGWPTVFVTWNHRGCRLSPPGRSTST